MFYVGLNKLIYFDVIRLNIVQHNYLNAKRKLLNLTVNCLLKFYILTLITVKRCQNSRVLIFRDEIRVGALMYMLKLRP